MKTSRRAQALKFKFGQSNLFIPSRQTSLTLVATLLLGSFGQIAVAAGFGIPESREAPTEPSFFESTSFLLILSGAFVAALIVIVVMIVNRNAASEKAAQKDVVTTASDGNWKREAFDLLEKKSISMDKQATQELERTAFLQSVFSAIADHHNHEMEQRLSLLRSEADAAQGEKIAAEEKIAELRSELESKVRETEGKIEELQNKKQMQEHELLRSVSDSALVTQIEYRMRLKPSNENEKDRGFKLARNIISFFAISEPERLDEIKCLAYASEEQKRIDQYETIIDLYNEKIARVRTQDMDEEDRDDAIAHWKRLRDTEIEELTRASDV